MKNLMIVLTIFTLGLIHFPKVIAKAPVDTSLIVSSSYASQQAMPDFIPGTVWNELIKVVVSLVSAVVAAFLTGLIRKKRGL